jgi:hypothetical protein
MNEKDFEGLKIRISMEYISFIDVKDAENDNKLLIIKKMPIIIKEKSGASHWTEWVSPFTIQGGLLLMKNKDYQKVNNITPEYIIFLPYGKVGVYIDKTWGNYEYIKEGDIILQINNGIAKPTKINEYDYRLIVHKHYLSSRTWSAKIKVTEIINAIILHNDTTSTAIDSVALLVVLIQPNGYIRFEENSAPYRGGQELWLKRIILENEIKDDDVIKEDEIC